jgi:predicted nucleotidyltransferase
MHTEDLHIDRKCIADLCRRYGVARLEVFGSFVRGDARPDSDLDVLVSFLPGREPGIEYIAFCLELQAIAGRKVDLMTHEVVEKSDNPWFKAEVLRHIEELYRAPAA